MTYCKVYRFRMEPTQEQERALLKMAGARRWAWNWGLARKKEHYATTGKGLTYNQLAGELTAGDAVLVAGKLKWTSWTDKQGQKRTSLCVLARLVKRLAPALVSQEVHT